MARVRMRHLRDGVEDPQAVLSEIRVPVGATDDVHVAADGQSLQGVRAADRRLVRSDDMAGTVNIAWDVDS